MGLVLLVLRHWCRRWGEECSVVGMSDFDGSDWLVVGQGSSFLSCGGDVGNFGVTGEWYWRALFRKELLRVSFSSLVVFPWA